MRVVGVKRRRGEEGGGECGGGVGDEERGVERGRDNGGGGDVGCSGTWWGRKGKEDPLEDRGDGWGREAAWRETSRGEGEMGMREGYAWLYMCLCFGMWRGGGEPQYTAQGFVEGVGVIFREGRMSGSKSR